MKSHSKTLGSQTPYKSKLESVVAKQLRAQGIPFDYETLKIPYVVSYTYVPDFVLKSGIIIEAKGYFRASDRRKHLAIQQQHPHLDIRFVFENANKRLNKKTTMTYSQWCEKHCFLWAHKSIPPKWNRK